MKKRVNPLSRFKLVYRPGKTSLKIALLAVLVLSTAALIFIYGVIRSNEARATAANAESESLVADQQDLNQKIENTGSKDGVKEYAEEELGMVDQDAVIMIPGN